MRHRRASQQLPLGSFLHWRLAACKIDGCRRKAAFGRLCCFWGVVRRLSGLGTAIRAGKPGRRLAPVLARPPLGVAADRTAVDLEMHPVGGPGAALARQAAAIADAAEARRIALG